MAHTPTRRRPWAVQYRVSAVPAWLEPRYPDLHVTVSARPDGRWAVIYDGGRELSRGRTWDVTPRASDRSPQWEHDHWFEFQEALTLAEEAAFTIKAPDGQTPEDIIAADRQRTRDQHWRDQISEGVERTHEMGLDLLAERGLPLTLDDARRSEGSRDE